jgi:hypothetical protein
MAKFKAFPVPVHVDDVPLVVANGREYRCSGCGGDVPSGVWLYETIAGGMVVGLVARLPNTHEPSLGIHVPHTEAEHPNGQIVHQCGRAEV